MLAVSLAYMSGFLLGALAGFYYGRRFERFTVYDTLLASSDPQSWTAAHHVKKGHRQKNGTSSTDSSGLYSATPAHSFAALVDKRAPTIIQRPDSPPTTHP